MMKIADVVYPKGIGTHSVSKLTWALGGQYKQFVSDVGVEDAADGNSFDHADWAGARWRK